LFHRNQLDKREISLPLAAPRPRPRPDPFSSLAHFLFLLPFLPSSSYTMSLPGSSQAPPIVTDVIFNTINPMTACGSGTISWTAVGDPTALTLYVSNIGLTDGSTQLYNISLVADYIPSLDTYNWSPVNVPQGQYYAVASFDNTISSSPIFSVTNGTDLSCLPGAPPPSPSPTSTDGPPSTSSSSSGQTGVPVPVSGALSSGSANHVGAIAGGVIGGVALILLILLGLFFFLRLRRRNKRSRSASAGGDAVAGTGKWNGLSSRDSNLQSTLPTFAGDRKVPSSLRRQSAGVSSEGHGNGAEPLSPVASDEDLSTLAEEEKIAHANALGNAYFNTVTPIPYTGQHHHRRSSSGSNVNSPISQLSPAASTRSTTQNRAATLAKLDPNSPPKSPYSRRQSLDGRVLSSAPASAIQTPDSAALPAEMIPMGVNRVSSGPRRATRKPVPTYSPSDASDVTAAMEREQSTSSGGHGHVHASAVESATTLNSQAAWKTSASSREDVHSLSLSHKSSFGDGRPMHYLIPDMPPPQRN